jgi:cytochrome P450
MASSTCKHTRWLHSSLAAGDWPSTIRQLLGAHGVATMHGQQHLQARKMVAPAFAPKTALAYIPRTVELAENFCAEWADARTIQGFDSMKNFTFQVAQRVNAALMLYFLSS